MSVLLHGGGSYRQNAPCEVSGVGILGRLLGILEDVLERAR